MNYQDTENECGFAGNSDLYGLGVRVGLYLQMAAYLCAQWRLAPARDSNVKVISQLRNSVIVFFLSTLILLVREAAQRTIHSVEVEVLLWLTAHYLVMIIQDKAWREKNPKSARLMFTLSTGSVYFYVWFYFRGMDMLPQSGCKDDYAFFFARVSLYHWYRTVMKVYFVLAAVIYSLLLIKGTVAALLKLLCHEADPSTRVYELAGRFPPGFQYNLWTERS
jgi:hypothetical protein